MPGSLPQVLSVSLFPQDNTEILGFLLGVITFLVAGVRVERGGLELLMLSNE